MLKFIFQIRRRHKQGLLFLFDFIVVIFCLFAAFSLRLGYLYFPNDSSNMLMIIAISPLIALPIFTFFGLYNTVIRHVGFLSIWKISQATALYAIIWGLAAFMLANWSAFPRSVVIINWLLIIFMIGGSRLFIRWLVTLVLNSQKLSQKNVIIYGAGEAGRQLSNALSQSSEYNPVLFIDDSIELQNQSISGLEIYSRDEIGFLIKKHNVKEVLLALPSLSHSNRSKIINFLKSFPVVVRSIPGVSELAKGEIRVNDLHEIDIRDILGRDIVSANNELLKTNVYKKVVLVTGAGGSIGSEICRQILSLKPAKLIMFDFSESSIYTIDQELKSLNQFNVEIYPVIGSILDAKKLNYVFESFKVQTIYHAAAYKHVPLVEQNPSQGILNNSIGTMISANCAISKYVETFVLISTDKAVRPTSVMGASKRIAELVLQALNKEQSTTCFAIVRFGNVLDSSGSVLPLFKKQIKDGGPVTVTHPDVVRFFMTIPEAVELVIQAGAMAKGGDVFVLDMGEPVRIYDLAVKLIQLSGLELINEDNPNGDIDIIYTGLRPGEKLFEELFVDYKFNKTENRLILTANEEMISWKKLEPMLSEIKKVLFKDDDTQIYNLIKQIVPQFNLTRNNLSE